MVKFNLPDNSKLIKAIKKSYKKLNSSITRELNSVLSLIRFNNLVSVIQTYLMYKVNLNTKSLRN